MAQASRLTATEERSRASTGGIAPPVRMHVSEKNIHPFSSLLPSKAAKYYDARIDFFRGLALIFIFINHIPENTFSYFTSRTVTLFDSAEVFMFLAGYSAALSYFSLAPLGIQPIAKKALKRARTILCHHLVLLALLMPAAFVISEAFGVKTGYEVFFDKIGTDPLQVAIAAPLLGFQAPLLDILPMYVVVMLIAPFLIWLRSQSEAALLVASGLMWMFATKFIPAIPTITYDVSWNFNPFCWQFLFAIGLMFGWRTKTAAPAFAEGAGQRTLDLCCGFFVAFSAIVSLTIFFQAFDDAAASRLRAMYFTLNKQCLDIWRVAGLLATAYLMSRVVSRSADWLKSPAARWVSAAGASSLPIFSLTVVLSFAGKFVTQAFGGVAIADGAVTGLGVTIIIAVALALRGRIVQSILDNLYHFVRLRISAAPQTR